MVVQTATETTRLATNKARRATVRVTLMFQGFGFSFDKFRELGEDAIEAGFFLRGDVSLVSAVMEEFIGVGSDWEASSTHTSGRFSHNS